MHPINCRNEEEVKIQIVLPWLESLGYKKELMEFEKTIEVNEGRKSKKIFADIVIYTSKKKDTPIIVVDTKAPNEILSTNGKNQVISYARLLPKIAPIAILTNGNTTHVYQTLDKSRIHSLPPRNAITKDFVSAVLSKSIQDALKSEATKELFTIDDVSTFKSLLKRCHNIIRNNEGYDPVQAFDEMSKILFAKMYEEQYHKESNRFTKKVFDSSLRDLGVNIVQKMFSEIQTVKELNELFNREEKINLKDRTIKEIVEIFESYDLTLTNFDVKGEAFEFFLGDTFTGGLGEYFTPRNIVEFIVEANTPKIGAKIVDPFCGTGGFLIYAFEKISEKIRLNDFAEEEKEKWRTCLSNESLYGTDWKERNSQACKMNMIIHGDGRNGVFKHDGFLNVEGFIHEDKFDICFTNPPFGAYETDKAILDLFELGKSRNSQAREILAIERCLNLVKKGTGIVAMILPDGILNGDRNSYVREFIHKEAYIEAVIGLNKETFEGYNTQAKTSIIFLRRKEIPSNSINNKIFMAVCQNSGYAPTGLQISGNELPDILLDWQTYKKQQETPTKEESDFVHFFKNTRIVEIANPQSRLDAESYISIDNECITNFEDTIDWFEAEILNLSQAIASISKELSLKSKNVDYNYIRANEILKEIRNIVKFNDGEQYTRLGISGKGNGFFKKETESKAVRLNQVEKNWFVYNRLFAHNGSFAYVTEEFVGGCLSNEFPSFNVILKGYNTENLLEYLCFYFSSPKVSAFINRKTTGSTKESRARFKSEQLLQMLVPFPKSTHDLDDIVQMIIKLKDLKSQVINIYKKIEELPQSYKNDLPFHEE